MEHVRKVCHGFSIYHSPPIDPSSVLHFRSAWSPPPSSHQFLIHCIGDDECFHHLAQEVRPPQTGKGDNGVRYQRRSSHAASPDLLCELSLQLFRAHPNCGDAIAPHHLQELPAVQVQQGSSLRFGEL